MANNEVKLSFKLHNADAFTGSDSGSGDYRYRYGDPMPGGHGASTKELLFQQLTTDEQETAFPFKTWASADLAKNDFDFSAFGLDGLTVRYELNNDGDTLSLITEWSDAQIATDQLDWHNNVKDTWFATFNTDNVFAKHILADSYYKTYNTIRT